MNAKRLNPCLCDNTTMARRRRMTAKQRRYFGKRKTRTIYIKPKRRKRYSMARHRFRSYARKGIGGFKGMIIPIGAGIADSYLDPMLPIDGIGASLVGMVGHNETVKNIGLYKVGMSLGNILPLPGRGATSGGGF